ncbi:leucine-rich repeat protein [Plasmodium relictum]|uniref:Leucine-rich repeat protein n=1 Tax=Plasmodium relictum TaxID=85471 RepID=A0A1J1H591_PLARL|nr:leucine-rich repeat protein [Plasmodium relictum]CRH00100.1 leucine-rich repeat protein [Plasmodium relictum]
MGDKNNEKIGINNLFVTNNLNNKNNNINNDKKLIIDNEKKKSIWSLFSNVEDRVKENKDFDNTSIDNIFSVKNVSEKGSGMKSINKNLFKNVQNNYEIKKEIENISDSYKRRNNILLTENTDDNILSNIISAKRIKTNQEKNTPGTYNSYKEFFLRNINQSYNTSNECKNILDKNSTNNNISYKIKDDNIFSRMKKIDKDYSKGTGIVNNNNNNEINILPSIKQDEKRNINTTIIKKKNICVPVNVIKENKKNIIKKPHGFSKSDKFDIFNHIGDDIFRYILSNIKNKNLLLLNKRFSEMIQLLRIKLIYDESLKNSISPESIIKTIYASQNIEILDLSGCSHITSHHFNLLCNSNNIKFNRTLKVLCLKGCNKITDSSLKILLHRFKNLKIVDIRNCYKISHDGIYPLKFKSTLRKLYMGNATSANVSNYHSNETLKVLFSCNKENIQLDSPLNNLVCFEITYAKQLSDISYLYIIANNLRLLNLKGCSIDDSSSIFFQSFTNLLALNLSDTKISNEVLKTVLNSSKKIKILDISKTFEIQNDTILQIPKNLRELRKIKLSSLQNVDNFCIRELLKYCRHLISIDFSSCWKVNNSFCNVNGLEIASGNKLKDIGAFQCSIDRKVCEGCLSEVGCTFIRVHIYNELKIFETSIYTDIESLETN